MYDPVSDTYPYIDDYCGKQLVRVANHDPNSSLSFSSSPAKTPTSLPKEVSSPPRRKMNIIVVEKQKGFWKLYLKQRYRAIKPALPYVCLLVYWFAGALVFYMIEKALTPPFGTDQRVTDENKCVGKHGYWGSIFYVLTVSSTIGFGSLYACTVPTKILTIIYSLCGLPQMIFVLTDMGKRACTRLVKTYKYINEKKYKSNKKGKHDGIVENNNVLDAKKLELNHNHNYMEMSTAVDKANNPGSEVIVMPPTHRNAQKYEPPPISRQNSFQWEDAAGVALRSTITMKRANGDDISVGPDIPIWLGFALIFGCIFLTALYFNITDNYPFISAIYYAFLFFLAGDFNTEKHYLTIPTYLFLFCGFATVSTTISIVLYNIENMIKKLKHKINLEIIERQEQGFNNYDDADETDGLVEDLLEKHVPIWLRQCIPEAKMTELVTFCQKEAVRISEEYSQAQVEPEPQVSYSTSSTQCCQENRTIATETTKAQLTNTGSQYCLQPFTDHATDPMSPPESPEKICFASQTDPPLRHSISIQRSPSLLSRECNTEPLSPPLPLAHLELPPPAPPSPPLLVVAPELSSRTPLMVDRIIQYTPRTRTVKTQFPIGQYIGNSAGPSGTNTPRKPFLTQ